MRRSKKCILCKNVYKRPKDYGNEMWASRKYCGLECNYKGRKGKKQKNGRSINKIQVSCENCKKILYKWPYEIKKYKYFACSSHCKGKANFKLNKDKVLKSAKKAQEAMRGMEAWNKGLTKDDPRVAKYAKAVQKYRKENPEQFSGTNHPLWKGDDAGYIPKHLWIVRQLGRPKKCEHCGTTSAKRFNWANKDHEYRRNLDDWIRLCTSCHKKYDNKKFGFTPWNKGKKLGFTPKRAFKKGNIPWNKGKRGTQIAWNKGKTWSSEVKEKISRSHKKLTKERNKTGRFI